MAVDYDTFLKWASGHFGSDNLRLKNNGEILANSPFANHPEPDRGYNLWMNPAGGKKQLEGGAFRCWKTDKKGTLVLLVSTLDNIPYDEAEEMLCGITSLRRLEQKLDSFFGIPGETEVFVVEEFPSEIELPPHTYEIDCLSRNNYFRQRAEEYLEARKIPIDGLFVCTKGDYKDRIVIPYYDRHGTLIYFNARTMSKNEKVIRYMKPDDESLDQNKILYMKEWPEKGSKVYITEGEFDAMSLNLAGLYGVACGGKTLSDEQANLLRCYTPVIATDNDEGKSQDSGLEALITIGNQLREKGFGEIFYLRPPKGYKDWNALLQQKGAEKMRAYIDKFQKPFTASTEGYLRSAHLG